MSDLNLHFIGWDSWDRPVYKGEDDQLFKDVNPRKDNLPEICTTEGLDDEPDFPVETIERYKNSQIHFFPSRITW